MHIFPRRRFRTSTILTRRPESSRTKERNESIEVLGLNVWTNMYTVAVSFPTKVPAR